MRQIGGGEILRACLQANAVDSIPFFYTIEMTGSDGSANATTTTNTMLQTEGTTAFLQTSLWGIGSNAFVNQPEFIGLYDAAKYQYFMDGTSSYTGIGGTFTNPHCVFEGLLNDSLASCVTLPEYILWGPSSLIGVTWLGRNNLTTTAYRYLVLGGIKYFLKGD